MNPFEYHLTLLGRSLLAGDRDSASRLAGDMADAISAMRSDDTPPSGAPAMPAPPPVALLFEAVA